MKNNKGLNIISLSVFLIIIFKQSIEAAFNIQIPFWVTAILLGIGFLLMAINVFWVQRANKSYQFFFVAYTLIFGLLIFFQLKQ